MEWSDQKKYKFLPFWSEKCQTTPVFRCLLALSEWKRVKFEIIRLGNTKLQPILTVIQISFSKGKVLINCKLKCMDNIKFDWLETDLNYNRLRIFLRIRTSHNVDQVTKPDVDVTTMAMILLILLLTIGSFVYFKIVIVACTDLKKLTIVLVHA